MIELRGQIQTISCRYCGHCYAACMSPECYNDEDWSKEVVMGAKLGHTISMVDHVDFKFDDCECKKHPPLY